MSQLQANPPQKKHNQQQRRGAILVLAVFTVPIILAFCAFAIDIGYIAVVDGELQNAADSAALAAAGKLLEDRGLAFNDNPDATLDLDFFSDARDEALLFAGRHEAGGVTLSLDRNASNGSSGDLVFGRMDDDDPSVLNFDDPTTYNTVRVTLRRDDTLNGQLALYFGRVLGLNQVSLSATAQASFHDQIQKLKPAETGGHSTLAPFAIDRRIWDALIEGQTAYRNGTPLADIVADLQAEFGADQRFSDAFGYNDDTDVLSNLADGILEMMMFPDRQGGGNNSGITPGNFGTVDIGRSSNATSDLVRQILDGPSSSDFDAVGGELDFSQPFILDGEVGISVGIENSIETILGETRTILLYDNVSGTGDTAGFTIVGFVGVRFMEVQLNGNQKRIMIQPAPVYDSGAVSGPGAPNYNVTSPVFLSQ